MSYLVRIDVRYVRSIMLQSPDSKYNHDLNRNDQNEVCFSVPDKSYEG